MELKVKLHGCKKRPMRCGLFYFEKEAFIIWGKK